MKIRMSFIKSFIHLVGQPITQSIFNSTDYMLGSTLAVREKTSTDTASLY